MTPFYLYLPLAIIAFAGIDKLRGRPRIPWVANVVVAVVLYLLVWSTHLL